MYPKLDQNLLEQEFSALPLRCKASDGPHFDLNTCVELFVPHVPHSLDWCSNCFVLQNRSAALLILVTPGTIFLGVVRWNPKPVT